MTFILNETMKDVIKTPTIKNMIASHPWTGAVIRLKGKKLTHNAFQYLLMSCDRYGIQPYRFKGDLLSSNNRYYVTVNCDFSAFDYRIYNVSRET